MFQAKFFECYLCNTHASFDMYLCLIEYLLVSYKVSDTLVYLKDFGLIEIQSLKVLRVYLRIAANFRSSSFSFWRSRIVVPIGIRDGTVPFVSAAHRLYQADARDALSLSKDWQHCHWKMNVYWPKKPRAIESLQ